MRWVYKFAHIADCHLGAQKYPELKKLELKAFNTAIRKCIEEKVDFVIISGDIFHSNIPDMNVVNEAVKELKSLHDSGIPVYVIYGSHDYSPNQTSMVDIIASAGLITKVVEGSFIDGKLRLKFTEDEKTGAKIVGLSARKRGLEREYFKRLDRKHLEKEPGFKIFVFHSGINELKPEFLSEMESIPLSLLPSGFNYYAGGHIHKKILHEFGKGYIAYPGPLFAGYMRDLEKSAKGSKRGFFIVKFKDEIEDIEFIPIELCKFDYIEYDATGKTALQAREELLAKINLSDVKEKIVVIKVKGELASGKTSEINFSDLRRTLIDKGALHVALNYHSLTTREFTEIKIKATEIEEIEDTLLKENLANMESSLDVLKGEKGFNLAKNLLSVLRQDQKPNEKKEDYENRILREAISILGLEEVLE